MGRGGEVDPESQGETDELEIQRAGGVPAGRRGEEAGGGASRLASERRAEGDPAARGGAQEAVQAPQAAAPALTAENHARICDEVRTPLTPAEESSRTHGDFW